MNVIRRATLVLSLIGVIVVSSVGGARADVYSYTASLISLPTDQGWQKEATGRPFSPSFDVHKRFVQDSTDLPSDASDRKTSWNRTAANNFDFFSSNPTTLEARLEVVSSRYLDVGSAWRSGYALAMTDKNNYHVILGISGAGELRLTNDNQFWNTASDYSSVVVKRITTEPTIYTLVAQNGKVDLFLNNATDSLLSLKLFKPNTVVDRANTFRFGDISVVAGSETILSYVNAEVVPEPSSLLLFAGMMGLGVVCWRRKRGQQ